MAELRAVNINGDESDVVNAYSRAETDALIATRAPQSTTYTKTEVDNLIGDKANATILTAGENYPQSEIENALESSLVMIEESTDGKKYPVVDYAFASSPDNYIELLVEHSGGYKKYRWVDDTYDGVTTYPAMQLKTVNSQSLEGSGNIQLATEQYVDDKLSPATDAALGLVKTDSTSGITLNQDNQLEISGRLGQFSSEEVPNGGLYYPLTIQPEKVGKYSLLMSEATALSVNNSRIFALFAGASITLKKSAAAGATTFEVSNTFGNRFTAAACRGGYMTIDEANAGTIMVKVTSVHTANDPDTQLVPYSGATESGNNIIITTDAPLSTTDSITKVRVYGSMNFDSSLHIGQGVGTGGATGKGKLLQLGQSQCSLDGNSIIIGNGMFNSKNRVFMSGANHINLVQGACLTGEGHDTTNGTFVGVAAHGRFSDVSEHTAFAIGNGTSNTARSNLFEILDDGRVKATSTPVDPEDLANKAYVDAAVATPITLYGNADFSYTQVLDPDTSEVINECVAYSTTAGNAHEPKAVKYGRVVNLCGAFKNINVRPDNSGFEMGSVPTGCEPLYTQNILVQGTSQAKFLLTIGTDGKMTCARYSTGASAVACPNNAWLNINATYISAS